MKSIFNKRFSLLEKKITWRSHPHLKILIFIVAIFSLHGLAIHPYLRPTMTTVPIELGVAFILILSVVVALIIIFITLLMALIVALRNRSLEIIKPWLLMLRKQSLVTATIVLVLAIFVLCTQWTAYTPPILGNDGEPLSGSIASLEKVDLEGSKQWITIRGNNKTNPILLFLAGGPGGSQLAATRDQLKELENNFVVVNWDQPGAGKSYHAVPLKSLTPERYIADAHQLTKYLREKLNQEKIYLVGESWGSALGIWLVQRYPEDFHAFIGISQMVDFTETEILDYEQALKIAKARGDTKIIDKLKIQGPPPYYGDNLFWNEATYLSYLNDYMTNNPDIHRPGYNTLSDMAGPEYGLYDKVNFVRGIITTFSHVYEQLYDFDLRKQAVKIDVPVYFMEGRHDVNAPPVLVEEYYKVLIAPRKEFIWFEHSGHSPWINERDKFVERMVDLRTIPSGPQPT